VHWSAGTGARLVQGAEHVHHLSFGGARGFLGLPSGERTEVAPGVFRQVFTGGHVVTSDRGTFSVRGALLEAWLARGGPTGALGVPISNEYDVVGGSRNDFVGGSLVWSARTGAVTQERG
jgi:hypothetical protein